MFKRTAVERNPLGNCSNGGRPSAAEYARSRPSRARYGERMCSLRNRSKLTNCPWRPDDRIELGSLGTTRLGLHAPREGIYADPAQVAFVRPGLRISVVSANIASDGTVGVDYKLTDPDGAPLNRSGIATPGSITLSFLAAYIPARGEQYTSYIVRTVTAVSGGATATQATADSGGSTQTVTVGEYIYTYKTKAPAGFRSDVDQSYRNLWLAQSDRIRSGHKLRGYHL